MQSLQIFPAIHRPTTGIPHCRRVKSSPREVDVLQYPDMNTMHARVNSSIVVATRSARL